jgi:hypothetical protein
MGPAPRMPNRKESPSQTSNLGCSDQQGSGKTPGHWLSFGLSALDRLSKKVVGRTGFEPVTSSVSRSPRPSVPPASRQAALHKECPGVTVTTLGRPPHRARGGHDPLIRSNGQFVHARPRPVSTSGLHLCRWPGVHGCPRPWQQVWQQSSPPEHLSVFKIRGKRAVASGGRVRTVCGTSRAVAQSSWPGSAAQLAGWLSPIWATKVLTAGKARSGRSRKMV